jgi:hypothetical protein
MKTSVKSLGLIVAAGLAMVAAFSAAGAENGTARGGVADLLKVNQGSAAPMAVAPASKHHMANGCTNCRETWTTQTVREPKGNLTRTVAVETHLCGDCKTSIQTTGHGKSKQDVVVHVCKAPSVKMGSCCAK